MVIEEITSRDLIPYSIRIKELEDRVLELETRLDKLANYITTNKEPKLTS